MTQNTWRTRLYSYRSIVIVLMVGECGTWFQWNGITSLKQSSTVFNGLQQSYIVLSILVLLFLANPAYRLCSSFLLTFGFPFLLVFFVTVVSSTCPISPVLPVHLSSIRDLRLPIDLCHHLSLVRSIQRHCQLCRWRRVWWCLHGMQVHPNQSSSVNEMNLLVVIPSYLRQLSVISPFGLLSWSGLSPLQSPRQWGN